MDQATGHIYRVCFVCPYCEHHNLRDASVRKPFESDHCNACEREFEIPPTLEHSGRFSFWTTRR